MKKEKIFTGDEIISEILLEVPESSEILASYGVSCVGCHINQYETLKDGILGHGYKQDILDSILADINESYKKIKEFKNLEITELAKKKILQFQKEAGKENYGLRIEAEKNIITSEVSYNLDFTRVPEKDDRVLKLNGLKVFCDHESFKLLKNKILDYKKINGEEGFKFS